MATQRTNFTTPVGRLVMGSLYKAQTTDADNKPLLVKQGPNAGQPTVRYFFALAIPKNPGETHFAQTEWGQKIWQAGHAGFPQGQANAPTFAWAGCASQQPMAIIAGSKKYRTRLRLCIISTSNLKLGVLHENLGRCKRYTGITCPSDTFRRVRWDSLPLPDKSGS